MSSASSVSYAMTKRSPQNVLITGGSSGIGQAIALRYHRRGYNVAIAGRNLDKLEAASEDRYATYVLDVSSAESVEKVCKRYLVEHDNQAPDILINCAGVMIPGEFISMADEDYWANIDVDFKGTVLMCKAFAPAMVDRGSGQIVNVASVAGFLGIYGYTGYSAAKFAVMGFSEALRFELEPHGVTVHVVCPPDTNTPGLALEQSMRPKETDAIAGSIKPVSADVVAHAVVSGIDRKKNTIVVGALSRLYYRLKGVWPELFYWIVSSDVKKARKN